MSEGIYKCLGIAYAEINEGDLDMLVNVLEKIYYYTTQKVYSKEEIELISNRLNIDCFSSFAWAKSTDNFKIVCAGISILRIKESKVGNVSAINTLNKIGFIFGSNGGFEKIIHDDVLYSSVFKSIKSRFNLLLQNDFTFNEFKGVIYEFTNGSNEVNVLAITK